MGNNKIYFLTDYKGFFGSKQNSNIYRSGMDIKYMIKLFQHNGFTVKVVNFAQINYAEIKKDNPFVLYTSSEDNNNLYKSFIEDIIYDLEKQGIQVIPEYAFLRAHNNKNAMELLRQRSDYSLIKTIKSKCFGTIAELKQNVNLFTFPVVVKPASGAMSRGVSLAKNANELVKKAHEISSSKNFMHDLKEFLRIIKYRESYIKESFHRNKFIVQNLIPGLSNDWKVLVYGKKCYVLFRGNRDNDFRASGSGKFVFRKDIPDGMLDYALSIKTFFNVPHISLDIGFDGTNFHLIEFQFLYFGTTTIEKSSFFFEKNDLGWELKSQKSILEEVYAKSIIDYIAQNNLKS